MSELRALENAFQDRKNLQKRALDAVHDDEAALYLHFWKRTLGIDSFTLKEARLFNTRFSHKATLNPLIGAGFLKDVTRQPMPRSLRGAGLFSDGEARPPSPAPEPCFRCIFPLISDPIDSFRELWSRLLRQAQQLIELLSLLYDTGGSPARLRIQDIKHELAASAAICQLLFENANGESVPLELRSAVDGLLKSSKSAQLDHAALPTVIEHLKACVGRIGPLPTDDPAGKKSASLAGSKKLPVHATAKDIARAFGWPLARVRSELSKAYYGPDGAASGRPAPDRAFWRVDVPYAGGRNPKFLWVTRYVIQHLKPIFEKHEEKH